jgi:hypothetical protein
MENLPCTSVTAPREELFTTTEMSVTGFPVSSVTVPVTVFTWAGKMTGSKRKTNPAKKCIFQDGLHAKRSSPIRQFLN